MSRCPPGDDASASAWSPVCADGSAEEAPAARAMVPFCTVCTHCEPIAWPSNESVTVGFVSCSLVNEKSSKLNVASGRHPGPDTRRRTVSNVKLPVTVGRALNTRTQYDVFFVTGGV